MHKKKVIVSFVSEQTVPIFLFIKTMFEPGDEVWLIASKDDRIEKSKDNLIATLGWNNATIKTIQMKKKGDEESWIELTRQLSPFFTQENKYIVGINGGTKMMNLALFDILSHKPESHFYYIPFPKNQIVDIRSGKHVEITYRLNVREHVSLSGHCLYNNSVCIRSAEDNELFFSKFVNGYSKDIYDALNDLRSLRGKRSDLGDNTILKELHKQLWKKKPIEFSELEHMSDLFEHFGFKPQSDGLISMEEICYLTGGWFEEWTFQQIQNHLNLDSEHIILGSHLDRPDGNELDVAFTKDNSLYVVECKSGIDKLSDLKSYLQKANSIRSNLKALSAKSVIFGLSDDSRQWHDAADYLGLRYISKNQIMEPDERFKFI